MGGVALTGGVGSMLDAFWGVLMLGTLSNSLDMIGISSFVQTLVTGVVIVLAAIVDGVRHRRRILRFKCSQPIGIEQLPTKLAHSGQKQYAELASDICYFISGTSIARDHIGRKETQGRTGTMTTQLSVIKPNGSPT